MEIHNRTSTVVGRILRKTCWTSEKMSQKTIGKTYMNIIELNKILIEIEAVVNSRPLTYPQVDINDASPLTPSHFLCGHRLLTLPDTRVSVKESDPDYIATDILTKELTKRKK